MAPVRNRMMIVHDISLKSQKVLLWLYIAEKHLKKEVGRAYCQSESLESNHWSIFLFILEKKDEKKGKGRTNDQSCRHIRADIVVWRQHETWRRLAFFSSSHFHCWATVVKRKKYCIFLKVSSLECQELSTPTQKETMADLMVLQSSSCKLPSAKQALQVTQSLGAMH